MTDLIGLLIIIAYFLFLVILASPYFGLHDNRGIFFIPRKNKKRTRLLVHKNVNPHAFNSKGEKDE